MDPGFKTRRIYSNRCNSELNLQVLGFTSREPSCAPFRGICGSNLPPAEPVLSSSYPRGEKRSVPYMNQPIRVLIVDDHTLFRESLSRLLESETEYKIVGTCASVDDALGIIAEDEIDLVLLDYEL